MPHLVPHFIIMTSATARHPGPQAQSLMLHRRIRAMMSIMQPIMLAMPLMDVLMTGGMIESWLCSIS